MKKTSKHKQQHRLQKLNFSVPQQAKDSLTMKSNIYFAEVPAWQHHPFCLLYSWTGPNKSSYQKFN